MDAHRLIVSFDTAELRELCASGEAAEAALGVYAPSLFSLIANVEAANDAADLILVLGEDVQIEHPDGLLIVFETGWSASFVAVGTKFARDAAGQAAWPTVQRLKLVKISRPNDA